MNAEDAGVSAWLFYGIAFLVPFLVCLLLARRGHARTAWWLPGGLLVMTLMFVGAGIMLSGEMQTGIGAARIAGTSVGARDPWRGGGHSSWSAERMIRLPEVRGHADA